MLGESRGWAETQAASEPDPGSRLKSTWGMHSNGGKEPTWASTAPRRALLG